MMQNVFSTTHDVVIAGAGVAAAFTAIRLLDFGFRPVILARRLRAARSAEAIPAAILRWQESIDIDDLMRRAGAVAGKGFTVEFDGRESFEKEEPIFYVERVSLARAALSFAVESGAAFLYCEKMPVPNYLADSVELVGDGLPARRFRYAVDATGRSASWSRPIARVGQETARIFSTTPPQNGQSPGGRIVTFGGNKGWAYRIDLPEETNVGVVGVGESARLAFPDDEALAKLGLPVTKLKLIARRPAFPQWAIDPCGSNRIFTVGDAAFAHNPIAGQGVFFALSSAVALAVVLRTCRDVPQYSDLALGYYRELIDSQKTRHLSFLENFKQGKEEYSPGKTENQPIVATLSPTELVEFSARVEVTGIRRDDFIVPEEAVVLSSGEKVRWLGEIDLLRLRKTCPRPVSVSFLRNFLFENNLSVSKTEKLIEWCLKNGVLSLLARNRGVKAAK